MTTASNNLFLIRAKWVGTVLSNRDTKRSKLALAIVALSLIPNAGRLSGQQRPSAWVEVSRSPALTITLDTSRVRRDSTGATVWLRFDYAVTNPPMSDMPHPWRRMASQHLVDCGHHRARDIAMIIIDTAGVLHDGSSGISTEWQAFNAHPLTPNVLGPVCEALQKLRSHRGA